MKAETIQNCVSLIIIVAKLSPKWRQTSAEVYQNLEGVVWMYTMLTTSYKMCYNLPSLTAVEEHEGEGHQEEEQT